jgi:hypothetical protein
MATAELESQPAAAVEVRNVGRSETSATQG